MSQAIAIVKKILVSFFSFFVFGCCSFANAIKIDQNFVNKMEKSVVAVKNETSITISNVQTSSVSVVDVVSYGSGAILYQSENATYVITAGHLCSFDKMDAERRLERELLQEEEVIGKTNLIFHFQNDLTRHGRAIFIENDYDLCVAVVNKVNLPAVNLSSLPSQKGKLYYTLGFPAKIGHGYISAIPLLVGFYFGKFDYLGIERHGFTIPVASGSSGSIVFDDNGLVVSIVIAKNSMFENVLYGTSLNQVNLALFYAKNFPRMQEDLILFALKLNDILKN